jgi:hypothetical protein
MNILLLDGLMREALLLFRQLRIGAGDAEEKGRSESRLMMCLFHELVPVEVVGNAYRA